MKILVFCSIKYMILITGIIGSVGLFAQVVTIKNATSTRFDIDIPLVGFASPLTQTLEPGQTSDIDLSRLRNNCTNVVIIRTFKGSGVMAKWTRPSTSSDVACSNFAITIMFNEQRYQELAKENPGHEAFYKCCDPSVFSVVEGIR
jgi:hypothetical protein